MIETMFDSSQEMTSSLQILKEWILTYISIDEVDFNSTRPTLTEGELYKPIFYYEILPGRKKNVGMGKRISQGVRGKFHDVAIMLFVVVTDSIGGIDRVRQLNDTLGWAFETRGFELEQAGLRKAEISSLRELTKENYGPFYGGRWQVTFRTTLVYV
jgi:hypothetical protein